MEVKSAVGGFALGVCMTAAVVYLALHRARAEPTVESRDLESPSTLLGVNEPSRPMLEPPGPDPIPVAAGSSEQPVAIETVSASPPPAVAAGDPAERQTSRDFELLTARGCLKDKYLNPSEKQLTPRQLDELTSFLSAKNNDLMHRKSARQTAIQDYMNWKLENAPAGPGPTPKEAIVSMDRAKIEFDGTSSSGAVSRAFLLPGENPEIDRLSDEFREAYLAARQDLRAFIASTNR